jgi:hypothetical protein
MLHLTTVEPRTFALLKKLMQMPALANCNLVGGTALALKLGHRMSVDLDLFSTTKLDIPELTKVLVNEFGQAYYNENSKITFAIFCKIENIKVDIVHYPHEIIEELELVDGLRIYSIKDIAAMKINAILGRGVKKDFYDLAKLLEIFTLKQIIDFHKRKYPSQMLLISIPTAITYFEDAEQDLDPITLFQNQTWDDVKKFIQLKVREYLS